MFKPCSKIKSSTFSLIEVLVVFAVIGVLLSLLQPSLKKVIEQANLITCSNNYRFIFMNTDSYTHDNMFYPNALTNLAWTNRGKITWDDLLGMEYDGRNISLASAESWTITYTNDGARTIQNQYHCPSDTRVQSNRAIRSYGLNTNRYSNSIRQGFSNFYDYGTRWSAHISEVPAPAKTFLFAERFVGFLGNLSAGVPYPNWQNTAPPHIDQFNYLFADGHSERFYLEDTFNPNIPAHHAGKYWTRDPND